MDVFQNMELFSELIQCGGNIYTWCYNADGSLLQSNCPEAGFLLSLIHILTRITLEYAPARASMLCLPVMGTLKTDVYKRQGYGRVY